MSLAVVVPTLNERHRLARSLAALKVQTRPADQVVVLDLGSSDGLEHWLRLRWPGVELATLRGPPLEAVVRCAAVALLEPGRRWPADHLARGNGLLSRSEALARLAAGNTSSQASVPAEGSLASALGLLRAAVGALPMGEPICAVGLDAATRTAGLLNLLGLAIAGAASGQAFRAITLAELSWTELAARSGAAPLLIVTCAPLDLGHAADQLAIEELVRRAGTRTARIVAPALVPTSPALLSRLIDLFQAHSDLQLWVGDAISHRYGVTLLGEAALRLVPPPILALVPPLRTVDEGRLVAPDALRRWSKGAADAASGFAERAVWIDGHDLETPRRLALALARLLGFARALRGSVLPDAWASGLIGWAALHQQGTSLVTPEPDLALFAAAAGQRVTLDCSTPKVRDFAATWPGVLSELGIGVAGPHQVGNGDGPVSMRKLGA